MDKAAVIREACERGKRAGNEEQEAVKQSGTVTSGVLAGTQSQ